MLSKDSFLKSNQNKIVKCEVEADAQIIEFWCKKLSFSESGKLIDRLNENSKESQSSEMYATYGKLIMIACLVDQDGNQILDDSFLSDEYEIPTPYLPVIHRLMEVNYLLPEQLDFTKKKSLARKVS